MASPVSGVQRELVQVVTRLSLLGRSQDSSQILARIDRSPFVSRTRSQRVASLTQRRKHAYPNPGRILSRNISSIRIRRNVSQSRSSDVQNRIAIWCLGSGAALLSAACFVAICGLCPEACNMLLKTRPEKKEKNHI